MSPDAPPPPSRPADLFDLRGRAAVVTGGSTGIGAATARVLAAAGAHVAVVARRPGPLDDTVAAIAADGGRAVAVPADLADDDQLDTVVDRCVEALGGLDVVVSNAGRAEHLPVAELDRARFDALVALDLWAPLRLAQLAHPHLAASDAGVLVTVGSIDAWRPSAGAAVYGAAKAGLAAATVALAKEWAADGVRVVQVDPGLVRTPMAAGAVADVEAAGARINLAGRVGEPHEIAALVLYLVSPAGRFADAASFRVDGGALALGAFDLSVGATRPTPR